MVKHIARKRFGQHFLTDGAVIGQIVRAIDPRPGDNMVEIGPGLAALTQPLVERVGRLKVIELDRDLAKELRKHPQLQVIEADVLEVDFGEVTKQDNPVVGRKLRVVGNLPYNISSPILFHLLPFADLIEDQHFMLQKEVVDRMVADPCTGDYGRLSVMLQWRYAMESVFDIPPSAFDPPPKVNSSIVAMQPYKELPHGLDVALLEALVKVAFSQRRKLLRHSLGKWLDERGYTGVFDIKRRAEEVPVSEYIALAQELA